MTSSYQFLPPLTPEERASLRDSIATFGILQPVIVDDDCNILDGNHRAEIAGELGIDYPTIALPGLSEEQKIEQSLALNLGRRHLTPEQKQAVIRDLRARGLSVRWISEKTGIPRSTVHRLAEGVPNGTPEYVGGRDGKRYRATVPNGTPRRAIPDYELGVLQAAVELKARGAEEPATFRIPATIEEAAVELNKLHDDTVLLETAKQIVERRAAEPVS